MTALYHVEYDGYYTMRWHDDEPNALKRWFENYKVERYAFFASDYECLVVSEVPSTSKRGGKRYHCDIVNDSTGAHREVAIDHTAPPAPTIFFAAKRKYEPPPPKTAQQQRAEAEAENMYRKGLRPMRIPVWSAMDFSAGPDFGDAPSMREINYRTEWVLQTPSHSKIISTPTPAPPQRVHRRNI